MRVSIVVLTAVAGVALAPSQADAYIGPGAGISAFGALLAVLAASGLGIAGLIWYPIKQALRALKPGSKGNAAR